MEKVVATEWTDDEMQTLSRMAKEGHSARTIAETLGRTRNSIIGRVHRSGIQLLGKIYPTATKRVIKKEPVIRVARRILIMQVQGTKLNFPFPL